MIGRTHVAIATHHLLALYGIWTFGWIGALVAVIAGLFFTRVIAEHVLHLGISHRHFQRNRVLDWLWAACAVLLGQGSTISWSVVHRLHHAYADTDKDPLSPFHHRPAAIWFNLIKVSQPPSVASSYAKDLIRSKAHLFCHRHYIWLHLGLCALVALVYLPALLLVVSPGIVYSFHLLGAVNTLSHMYGRKVDGAAGRDNTWVSMFALMRGNHGSHHANPGRPR